MSTSWMLCSSSVPGADERPVAPPRRVVVALDRDELVVAEHDRHHAAGGRVVDQVLRPVVRRGAAQHEADLVGRCRPQRRSRPSARRVVGVDRERLLAEDGEAGGERPRRPGVGARSSTCRRRRRRSRRAPRPRSRRRGGRTPRRTRAPRAAVGVVHAAAHDAELRLGAAAAEALRVEVGDHPAPRKPMRIVVRHRGDLARLHRAADQARSDGPVGDRCDLVGVVRDEQRRRRHVARRTVARSCAELVVQLAIEPGQRLVEQQHRRLRRERAGQRDPLRLAAAQRRHRPPLEARRARRGRASRSTRSAPVATVRAAASATRTRRCRRRRVGEQLVVLEDHPDRGAGASARRSRRGRRRGSCPRSARAARR